MFSTSPRSSVGELPFEILSHIFCFLRDMCIVHGKRLKLEDAIVPWIQSATHVCRHWRGAALSCPQLWADLDDATLQHPLWRLAIYRSGLVPLHLSVNFPRIRDLGEFGTIMYDHGDRVRSLTLLSRVPSSGVVSVSKLERSVLNSSFQNLEDLEIDINYLTEEDQGGERDTYDCLFYGIPPRLTRLTLCANAFTLSHPIYDNLTELTFRFVAGVVFLDASELGRRIEEMPRLRVLELHRVILKGVPMTSRVSPPPSLRKFIMVFVHHDDLTLPTSIAPSPHLSFDLTHSRTCQPNSSPTVYDAFLGQHAGHDRMPRAYALSFTRAKIHNRDTVSAVLRLFAEPGEPFLTFRRDFSEAEAADADVVFAQLPCFGTHLSAIEEASIDSDAVDLWPALLHCTPRLRTLRLRCGAFVRIVGALLAAEAAGTRALPDLRSVVIESWDFADREEAMRTMGGFMRWRRMREDRGAPLRMWEAPGGLLQMAEECCSERSLDALQPMRGDDDLTHL
ncbi:hypothetical protein K488DRAFT_87276 [Vararia minispora EC-137]|uniref:Uncharacterized protein n=1 Tax=Vararia minispora EC-137 TaxID=1314806 RepID=A0ACB8QHD1_9AGAM|nr:hypothetical protein K488DRAFT_87276 [Vararia minispora EC-137]